METEAKKSVIAAAIQHTCKAGGASHPAAQAPAPVKPERHGCKFATERKRWSAETWPDGATSWFTWNYWNAQTDAEARFDLFEPPDEVEYSADLFVCAPVSIKPRYPNATAKRGTRRERDPAITPWLLTR